MTQEQLRVQEQEEKGLRKWGTLLAAKKQRHPPQASELATIVQRQTSKSAAPLPLHSCQRCSEIALHQRRANQSHQRLDPKGVHQRPLPLQS